MHRGPVNRCFQFEDRLDLRRSIFSIKFSRTCTREKTVKAIRSRGGGAKVSVAVMRGTTARTGTSKAVNCHCRREPHHPHEHPSHPPKARTHPPSSPARPRYPRLDSRPLKRPVQRPPRLPQRACGQRPWHPSDIPPVTALPTPFRKSSSAVDPVFPWPPVSPFMSARVFNAEMRAVAGFSGYVASKANQEIISSEVESACIFDIWCNSKRAFLIRDLAIRRFPFCLP